MSREIDDKIKIGGCEISVKRVDLELTQLKYYPENPRIYSVVYVEDKEPSQQEIEDKLQQMEHVKILKQSIKANGGLIDPIMVRDGDFVVLEGNSRLAAYRLLIKEDVIKWGKISAILLPSDIDDKLIFTLLGQYHIIGRKDWSPFEQAGYLWRRHKHYKVVVSTMAKEMGMSEGQIRKLILVYDFMNTHGDVDQQHWSYYDEFLKSKAIKKHRDDVPELDQRFAEMVQDGEISAAIDVREKLQAIARVPGQKGHNLIIDLVEGEKSFEDCFAEAEKSGATNSWYQTLNRFRMKIADPNAKKYIKKMDKKQQKKCDFELKKIEEAIIKIRKSLIDQEDEVC